MPISEHLYPMGVLSSDCVNSNHSTWKTERVVIGFINWTAERHMKKIRDDLNEKMSCSVAFCDYVDFYRTPCVSSRPTGQQKHNVLKCLRVILYIKKMNRKFIQFNSLSEYSWIYWSICSLSIKMPTKPTRSVSSFLEFNLLLH